MEDGNRRSSKVATSWNMVARTPVMVCLIRGSKCPVIRLVDYSSWQIIKAWEAPFAVSMILIPAYESRTTISRSSAV